MTTMWMIQVVAVTLIAGLGLGLAIRFSMMSRMQDRTLRVNRVAPTVDPSATIAAPVMNGSLRRAPTA